MRIPSLNESAVSRLVLLAAHHQDPFDRMLVCQAIEHDLRVVTVDPMLAKYPAKPLVAQV
ncbi:MAG TPA: hypothetical protein VEZ11_03565 [Thermoanaerobaculia bacterium]|nr:hypothetical protein [Thermoanaerobaculia bacterium]